VPEYILSRLQPTLEIGFPNRADEMAILHYNLPFAEEEILVLTVDFLQHAHGLDLGFSPRDGINVIRYALKRLAQEEGHPLSTDAAWREAIELVLGAEALDLDHLAEERRSMLQGGNADSLDLTDFFFEGDDPLRPDSDDKPD